MALKEKTSDSVPCEIPLLPIQASTSIEQSTGARLAQNEQNSPWAVRRSTLQTSASELKYLAVEVCEATYRYGKGSNSTLALQGTNLHIPRGVIYSLLGPSGCGKTTLLSAVAGIRPLSSGHIRLFGVPPGHPDCGVPGPWLGYMPQELCLYMDLTVEETLNYFGGLQGMTKDEIRKSMLSLVKMLDIPKDRFRLVKNLSGGQQRRLSLAVALFHGPPLIILDEPTVGVDPLLCRAIWRHLTELVTNTGKTICITTHYIEEARNANLVGFMRNGVILREGEPQVIMDEMELETLEKVFLELCIENESEKKSTVVENDVVVVRKSPSPNRNTKAKPFVTYNKAVYILPAPKISLKDYLYVVLTFTIKNVILLKRNFLILAILFGAPLGNILLSKVFFGHTPKSLPVAIVNNENPAELSKDFLKNLDLNILKQTFYDNSTWAIESVKAGKAWAAVHIPQNFTRNMLERMFLGLSADNDTVNGGFIHVDYDNSNLVIAGTIYMSLLKSFTTFARANIEHSGSHPKIVEPALTFEKPIFGRSDTEFTEYVMGSVLSTSIFLTSLSFTSLIFVTERANNMLERCQVSGLTAVQVFLSQALIHNVICITQILVQMLVASVCFVNAIGSFGLVGFLCYLQGNVGMTLGVLISVVTSKPYAALLLVSTIYQLDGVLNGTMWPLEGFPLWLRPFAVCSPGAPIMMAVRYVLYQDLGLGSKVVWSAILASTAWTLLSLLIAVFLFKRLST